jgi:5-methyltetrahydrofolate--homocysteine methyltransferase
MDGFRRDQFDAALASRILILDGAMGTMLQARRPTKEDYGGQGLDGCNENLCRTHPDWILDIHRAYLDAGADIVETNSFQGSSIVLAEFGLERQAHELNLAAARLARQAAAEFSTALKPRFVAGAIGPTTKSLTLRGDVTFGELRDSYYEQAKALVDGGVDLLLFETAFDTRNLKAGLLAVQRLERDLGQRVPLMVSATVERWGSMLAGQSIDAFYVSISHMDLVSIGLNCATGPELMTDSLRTLAQMAATRISCHPNAGLPDDEGGYPQTPELFAHQLERFVRHGWLNIVGGCCGTTPAHIRALAQMAADRPPHMVNAAARRTYYSGVEIVEAEENTRPLIVGERTNATGSRLFAQAIAGERWDEAAEIARRQVKHGAQIVDICLQSSDRDETIDIDPFYAALMPKIRVPVMVESTDPVAVERALSWCQGKSIINSISLEDGEEQFERICPIARAYGAAVVVGTIDEDQLQAQALTRERKLAVAERSVGLLVGKYGIVPEDVIIDPLVFPCASGDENYVGSAAETIEAVRLIKARIPSVKTLLGVSAVSFGLPDAARPLVNSVFLYHATKAGLDLAIVNAEKLQRFPSIPHEQRQLAENLLFEKDPRRSASHLAAIVDDFRETRATTRMNVLDASLDERLATYIIDGTRAGLIADLDLKLKQGTRALDIINGPLMAGMAEVGRMFNDNELIVAEVLQSAEAMNVAVEHLRQFMERTETATRGTVLLATVKGDVHDIGKNLVEIVLSNNGYQVVDLGIRVPPEKLIDACRERRPDAIGLSGLLVKSAHQMVATAADLRESGVDVPLIVGGAALSETFTRTRIGPAYRAPTFYARDAMAGLRVMNELANPAVRQATIRAHTLSSPGAVSASSGAGLQACESSAEALLHTFHAEAQRQSSRTSKIRLDMPIPAVSELGRHVEDVQDRREIWSFINPVMLHNRHLGFKGDFDRLLGERDPKAVELFQLVERTKQVADGFMRVRAVWQFFEAERDGNAIRLFTPGASNPVHTFSFRRQAMPDGLCLSDYVLDPQGNHRDHIALFVVTAGECVRQHAEEAKQRGEFLLSHTLQALAIETAEASAEWLHRRLRDAWGFPDPSSLTMQERLRARYRGKRYSFGYAACPDLEDQAGLWHLLRPEDIGVELTEGFMMDPEASVSALVFHHPECVYFSTEG